MIQIEDSIVVDLPRRQVFPLAASPENMPLWNTAVLESRICGALQRGARVVQRIHLMGHRFETVYEVSSYEPPRLVTYTSTSGPMDIRGTMEFESLRGATRIHWSVAGDCRGFLRVAEPVLVRAGRFEMHACLQNLKRFVEHRSAGHRTARRRPAMAAA
ncbi:MAG TPA: SRPBCC family protein [Actinomycetota bacterium]